MHSFHEWIKRLRPETRQRLIGISLSIDPLPRRRYETFERSDARAIERDWEAVGGDMWAAIAQHADERRNTAE